ncbi:hypothetical protein FNB15_04685 [Ferrovibrio terrae]|uniref:Uncharacterized protein n=1 Tax=Ferrovibrio terrae TaxID=2594003 RepID=A0A516GYJ9_9PROT|nr:hypothetical protein [Ferrovibrio terrae]QDO96614.1 hypothetical protein FNB15_04685 [Ferrovibrio terrae]
MTAYSWRQAALALLLAAGLAGCTKLHVEPLQATQVFTPQDEWGLVVMGLAAAQKPPANTNFMAMFWQRYDVARQTVIPAPAKDVPLVFNLARGFRHDQTGTDTTIRYGVTRVPPGDYVATDIMVQKIANERTIQEHSRTYGNQDKPVAANFLASDDQLSVAGREVPRITVKPGEIVYVGDFSIDANVFPVKIVRIEQNPARAKEELAKRPNLQGELRSGLRMKD